MPEKTSKESVVQASPECITEPVKALLLPVTTEIGTTLGDLLYHLTGRVHLSAEKARAKYEQELETFKEELSQEIQSKPVECLTNPKQQVVGQALDQVGNCLDEEKIRAMFAKLIANAADSRYQPFTHPSFPAMIAQLSPLDAENLSLFRSNPDQSAPIVTYKIGIKSGGKIPYFENCFLENEKMSTLSDLKLQVTSIASLQRQGIIEVSYTSWLTEKKYYDKFYTASPMISAQKIIDSSSPTSVHEPEKVVLEKGVVHLTSLGKDFVKVCFNT